MLQRTIETPIEAPLEPWLAKRLEATHVTLFRLGNPKMAGLVRDEIAREDENTFSGGVSSLAASRSVFFFCRDTGDKWGGIFTYASIRGANAGAAKKAAKYIAGMWLEAHEKVFMEQMTASARDMISAWDK